MKLSLASVDIIGCILRREKLKKKERTSSVSVVAYISVVLFGWIMFELSFSGLQKSCCVVLEVCNILGFDDVHVRDKIMFS